MRSLVRHCRLISACTILGAAIACAVAYQIPSTYTAHARVKLDRDASRRDMPGDLLYVKLQIEVMQSPPVLGALVDSLGTRIFEDSGQPLTREQAAAKLKQTLQVRRNADNNLVEICASAQDADRAVEIVNQLIDTYSNSRQKESADQAAETVQTLSNEVAIAQERVAVAQARVQQLGGSSVAPVDAPDAELGALQNQLTAARTAAIEQRLRAQSLSVLPQDNLAQNALATGDATAANLLEKFNDADSHVAVLQRAYGPQHSALLFAIEKRDQCKARLADWISALAIRAEQDVDRANQRVSQLQDEIGKTRKAIPLKADGPSRELASAVSDLSMEQDMVRLLRERIQTASLDLISGRKPIEVIERASTSTVRVMPWTRILTLGIFVSMLIGVVAGLMLDQLRPRIEDVQDLVAHLRIPVLGTVARKSRALFGQEAHEHELEHYRMLRNSIEFANEEFRSLCVSGAGGAEGRSLVAMNLAWAWAEQGARVLLVDMHRARPVLHLAVGIANNGGLTDALSTRRSLDKFVQHTSMPNLLVLTAGVGGVRGKAITAELLDEIHDWARDRVDIVIFDTPPLTRSSDAGVVARFADAVVLVVRRDTHAVSLHQRAVDILAASNCNLLGAILNDAATDQFELSHPEGRRTLPYRVIREQTLQDRVVRNARKAA